jgi:hypothetical protein
VTIWKDICAYLRVDFVRTTPLPNPAKSRSVESRSEPPVLAWLGRRDFALAQRAPGFRFWAHHDEFVCERDALYVGYGEAGVTARLQGVRFAAFESWARLTGAPIDVVGLDEFAAHWCYRVRHPHARVRGGFYAAGNPAPDIADADGGQRILVRRDVYTRWRDEFAQSTLFAPPDLDTYAAHVVECCVASERRARVPAVSSTKGSRAAFDERP